MRFLSIPFIVVLTLNHAVILAAPFAYVTVPGVSAVSVIDTATDKVIKTIAFAAGTLPFFLVPTPDQKKIYVSVAGANVVRIIDTLTNTIVGPTIPITGSGGIAITPDGKKVYAGDNNGNTVDVIDTATNKVIKVITVETKPAMLAVTPDGKFLYVPNETSNTIHKIDTATDTIVATITLNPAQFLAPTVPAITPDCKTVYVTCQNSNNVLPLAVQTNTKSKAIPVGSDPIYIALKPDGSQGYVTNSADFTVSHFAIPSNKIIGSPISAPGGAFALAITPNGKKAYVTNFNDPGLVTPIDLVSNTAQQPISVGAGPLGIIVLSLIPPSEFIGSLRSNIFLNKTEYVLTATWQSSPSTLVTAYNIYNGDTLIATVSAAGPLEFIACVDPCENLTQFSITAVDGDGVESIPVFLMVSDR